MKLVSISTIPGKEIEALGIVKGTIVQSKNIGRDFMAGMKTIVGGEIKGYTEMLNEARQIATKRMVDEAVALGADAIVGVKYGSSAVMQGAAEIVAYGTAVKILNWFRCNEYQKNFLHFARKFLFYITNLDVSLWKSLRYKIQNIPTIIKDILIHWEVEKQRKKPLASSYLNFSKTNLKIAYEIK